MIVLYELNDIKKVDQRLITSMKSCRLNLHRFGAKFTANAAHAYFLAHEREDMVKDREEFYTITDDFVPQWKISKFNSIILICTYCFSFEFL